MSYKQKNIRDGQVMISSGSVRECTYHFLASTVTKAQNEYRTVKGSSEILNASGIIADGETHIHVALSNPEKGGYRGHLRRGAVFCTLASLRCSGLLVRH